MLHLSEKERLRYLWNFLVQAAVDKLVVDMAYLQQVIPFSEADLDVFSKTCEDQKLPNITHVFNGRGTNIRLSPDSAAKLFHGLKDFKFINLNDVKEAVPYNLRTAKYCALYAYPDDNFFSAYDFLSSLDWEKVKPRIQVNLADILNRIVQAYFKAHGRDRKAGPLQVSKCEYQELIDFAAAHSFLIMHQHEFTSTLEGLGELEEHYREQKEATDRQIDQVDQLLQDVKKDLHEKAEVAVQTSINKADKLVVDAQKKYADNLLAGYVENFDKDAERYKQVAGRWLVMLVLSFVVTIGYTLSFLGKFSLQDAASSPDLATDLETSATTIIATTILVVMAIVAAKIFTHKGHELLTKMKISTVSLDGLFDNIKFVLATSIFAFPIMIGLYFFTHYFDLQITSVAITAESFSIPKDEIVNWAAFLSGAAPRVILLLLATGITAFCANMYRIQKHLEAANRYRVAALASFRVFSDQIDETDEGKARKEKLFDELAHLIYTPIETGFHIAEKHKSPDLANLVTALGKIGK